MRKAVIILPTYNEVGAIEQVITEIYRITKENKNWEVHVLVVDSNSQDGTQEKVLKLIKKLPRLTLLQTEKKGLGKAYVQGFQQTLERINPYLIFEMDADLSHDPKKIPEFLKQIENGADFVIGSRYIKGGSIPNNWGIHRKIFSVGANLVIRFGFMKPQITDWTSGFRAIKSWLIKKAIPHIKNYSGYVFQVAILDFAIKHKAHISEIPIQFKDRIHGKSKINSIQYIIQTFLYVFLNSSFIKFALVGVIGFIIDFGISFLFIEKLKYAVWLSTLLSTETAIVSNFLLNNFWSFSHKRLEPRLSVYLPNFLKFNFVSSGSVLIQTLGVQLAVNLFGRKLWYIYKILIIIFIIIPYSYILYNKFIWKEK
ncbi:hypothetical protein A3C98_01085 [Candidatus Roizmanbacteria bacterium RIFCSPHIGHO2_02_FULL_37_15]|uniref:Glycosyltransferase 2-like domain-containing protein n=1 Tax=Candidatus Roizmanbacteria bacterium RIFCSPLOWO2_01_FULL_37_16 TaxID=1802058 RepID=A0A1F7IPF8_9BACT|nr:MAG: hypothetical protein A2859_02880 [Candidatus Roizmanbacteria bacterium RIFCSPHIGHO2_01_FULL_37_16b]OGK21789.1 MAG: hypothetical protein A3C98_01085 [Candidatus Roizmanbacteria bacterium RIFCSPHIGHO2_02_FULL_37_15]OGK33730.1 MAG: hypothetical protein A3F57_04685 [Candidatus Roizmanbacteria bacterium RIFCSPHIGHO2_12_FULL_36_11]OGK45235.1 MAG: hypothetical protein A3B40_03260 [Candidatus Roizmanbacteria bacterium RIFCSPLOWO2_01_FULL_37_16]